MSRLDTTQLASRLRGLGASQEGAVMAFAEDGSCIEYLTDAANRLDRMYEAVRACRRVVIEARLRMAAITAQATVPSKGDLRELERLTILRDEITAIVLNELSTGR